MDTNILPLDLSGSILHPSGANGHHSGHSSCPFSLPGGTLERISVVANRLGVSAGYLRKASDRAKNPCPCVVLPHPSRERRYRMEDVRKWLNLQDTKENGQDKKIINTSGKDVLYLRLSSPAQKKQDYPIKRNYALKG